LESRGEQRAYGRRPRLGVVLLRVGANEVDDFAVAVGRLFLIASGLVDHSEAIPAVMRIGEARDEVAGGLLGLIELAGLDEVDGGVGRRGQLVLGLVNAGVGGGEAFGDFGVRWAFAPGWARAHAVAPGSESPLSLAQLPYFSEQSPFISMR
jgi:hypothetical protein